MSDIKINPMTPNCDISIDPTGQTFTPSSVFKLIFPHITIKDEWNTEIGIVNKSVNMVTGVLFPYNLKR